MFKLFKATIACENAARLELRMNIELSAGAFQSRFNVDLFCEAGIETDFLWCHLERVLVSTFREFRNIDPEYAHRFPQGSGITYRKEQNGQIPKKIDFSKELDHFSQKSGKI
jgi:hypothetical protein